jgi:SAM-dependent methyltransferase
MTRTRLLFGGAVFLAAFLLFLVEPMVAKQLLPVLGGSAAVWITCLVFFQLALFGAYAYAHWLARHAARWAWHLALLAAAAGLAGFWAFGAMGRTRLFLGGGPEHPVTTIFLALGVWIGLPFLALGATSPLLQVWWSRVENGPIPYRLFALSNLASLLALAAYPTLIEPSLTLHAQRTAWFCGFLLFGVLACVLTLRTRGATAQADPATPANEAAPRAATLADKLLWLLLPTGASMQLCAVTSYITANIAPIPLLWILPLGVYLLSIILAFEFPRLLPRGIIVRFLAVMLGGLAYMLSKVDHSVPIFIGISFFLVELFFAALFCHVEAYRLRPQRGEESTVFYLAFATGGALGSLLIGIVAPFVFSFNYDVAVTFFITALLALAATWRSGWPQRMLWSAAGSMLLVVCIWVHIAYQRGTLVAVRNFYSALRVKQNFGFPGATLRTLTNGSIEHGTQIFGTDVQRKTPTTYYAEDSGVGLALRFCCLRGDGSGDGSVRPRTIGVIGLGAGTLAAYGKPGDRIRFYEINPAVAPISQNVFTYVRDSAAQVTIVEGDARNTLAREGPQQFDVLVVDAFSGDAIPLHLLTAQALALYRRQLAPGGIIAFHISNQHVDLEPAIALLAQTAGMQAMRFDSLANEDRGEYSAYWVLVTDNADFFRQPEVAAAGRAPVFKPGLRVWTDDYSSLLPLLRW